jgi:DNA-binding LacI/PurR family transcriptional regulator
LLKAIFVENVKPLQQHRCVIYANEHANVDFACKALYNRDIRKEIQSMAVTIKDIAAAAGVSPSTVSRTCKDSPSISRDTKERIRRIMAQMGYEPNFEAEPSEAFSKTIGIILPSSQRDVYENAFHLEIIRGIGQFCNQRRYVNTVITGEDDAEVLDAIQSMVANTQADGFILLYSKKDCPVAAYLRSEGLLHVIVGKAAQSANQTIYIDNDNALAGEEATDYLYEMGHRRIAYFGVSNAMLFSAERKRGYQMSLLKHGITPREGDCVEIDTLNDSYEPALKALLTAPDRPTAVLVSDDILAVVLEQFCSKLGLRIPKDLSIVSFNNSPLANPLPSARITTVRASTSHFSPLMPSG